MSEQEAGNSEHVAVKEYGNEDHQFSRDTGSFCRERKQALSPYNFPGDHDCGDGLPGRVVDAVHRIITDQGRITQAWIDGNAEAGLSEEHYVELLGIAVTVFSIDEFNRALGLPLEPLPEPRPGEPDHYRPELAQAGTGYVPMLPPEGAIGAESDLWKGRRTANVLRALTLVPNALRDWKLVSEVQYLDADSIITMRAPRERALNRMQMEVVAGRVSSHNECFY